MPVKLRVSKQRFAIDPATEAFIRNDRDDPDYPTGMRLFWYRFSVSKGHRSARLGYNVEEACQALGVDFAAVRAREVERTRSPAMEAYRRELDAAAGR